MLRRWRAEATSLAESAGGNEQHLLMGVPFERLPFIVASRGIMDASQRVEFPVLSGTSRGESCRDLCDELL